MTIDNLFDMYAETFKEIARRVLLKEEPLSEIAMDYSELTEELGFGTIGLAYYLEEYAETWRDIR